MGSLKVREADVLRAVLDVLAASRIYALRINTGTGWAKGRPIQHHSGGAGVADIVAFPRWLQLPGRVVIDGQPTVLWIETKSSVGRQSPEQRSFEEMVKEQGMHYLLARSAEDVQSWISEHR